MSGQERDDLHRCIKEFLQVPPRDPEDLFSRSFPIPTEAERVLLEALLSNPYIKQEVIEQIRQKLDFDGAYDLKLFSLRMATLAARTCSLDVLQAGAIGLVVDEDLIDYRDVLIALGVFDDCAQRLRSNLEHAFSRALPLASRERRLIFEGYLRRPKESKGISAMNIDASGAGNNFIYSRRHWSRIGRSDSGQSME